jgi:hypothetical protein
MSYHRASSPGSRRLAHPARLSDGYYPAPTSAVYASPRSSGERLVPVSTPAFVARDAYSGRPRRSTLTEPSRPPAQPSAVNPALPVHPRSRPAVIQSSHDRTHSPSSPHAYSTSTRTPDYYAVPATTHRDHSHKKLYSIDGGGKSRLVADIDINTTHGSSHRRHSVDRNSDRHSSTHHRHKGYHLSGSSTRKTENDQGFSYTEPAAMYTETEPRWRHRAGSVEATRPRPSSTLVEPYPPRSSARESGPPTSRALDKFNDGAGRVNSTREAPRSSNRLSYQEPQYNDGYTSSSGRHSAAVHQDRTRDVYQREAERARPVHRYEDRAVERRGFGIRSGSQDRYNHNMNKGSNESFDAYQSDRDRDHRPPRSDPRPYDYPKESDRDREYRPRDKDRVRDDGYASERDRHHERDRRDPSRRDRDRDVNPRGSGDSLSNTLLPAAATAAIGSLGAMAAAAAYGSDTTVKGRDREYEDRDREKERDRDREREREQRDRQQEYERKQRERELRDRERDRDVERDGDKERERTHDRETRTRERPREKERDRPRHSSSSDSGQDRHRSSRRHRTLGADGSPPQEKDTRAAPDERQRAPEPDRTHPPDERQRVPERERAAPTEPAEIDPDEDYRRRMEQAQRDLQDPHDNMDPERDRRLNGAETIGSRASPPNVSTDVDYSENKSRENRVRIVEPPSDREDSQPVRGILKRPTQKFPEDPHPMREGVKPLKEVR